MARARDLCVATSDLASGHGDPYTLGGMVHVKGAPLILFTDRGTYPRCTLGADVPWFVSEGHPRVLAWGRPVSSDMCQTAGPNGFGQMKVVEGHDVYVGGPTVTMLEAARINARRRIARAIEAIRRWSEADRARFRRWFGEETDEARLRVLGHLAGADDKLTRADVAIGDDRDETVAHVYASENTIYVDERFWREGAIVNPNDPETKFDTQSGAFVHEATHFEDAGRTRDHAYGRKNCLDLASRAPETAQRNADSYQYFTEDEP